ncbi:RlmE family RNA methyltransferase [Pseudoroseomonas wenyumeiae]|uniref:Ribosomal RNA large subunit methyltransferase E n=1 Tax=Teichococcus wenyumeiae TaxID=2478470 RepID=A0A3A9JDA0_9PROT|nr:RlmE family RNA methyltransferase [Pseudoroseomonas wenyumeiae]RKK03391.1 RlmE family RNA methyltransferase [Pseudoroseomonas wenyumeiae]RMI17120.1 RlmE family RNA methyltransferase [Pseudoroseomonas wenyumeiae]
MKPPIEAGRGLSTRLRTAKGRTTASQKWLERQLNDPYVRAAKAAGWRSRAAFKILELDEKYHIFKPGQRVVDLGAAPGGWTQVAVQRVGASGKVVALDLLPMDEIAGATLLQGDFQDEAVEQAVLEALDGPAELVLSDMAPNTTGHNATDHLRILGLIELALDFAGKVLVPGGAFVAKAFQGGTEREILNRMKRDFATVKHAKPPASRKGSAEMYVVAQGFRGQDGQR